ncbi:uncharacterized protein LOC130745462 [Lotus japonicus]|uniref:uncharacterized protein LOC130745462 n=1 Tax=Lotus japonicus TaxID=34305 RepID=UPI002586986E|nr:uncharacterized protein LOC130745462 [Lotus japonicus]
MAEHPHLHRRIWKLNKRLVAIRFYSNWLSWFCCFRLSSPLDSFWVQKRDISPRKVMREMKLNNKRLAQILKHFCAWILKCLMTVMGNMPPSFGTKVLSFKEPEADC